MELSQQANLQRRINVNTDDIKKVVLQSADDVHGDVGQATQQTQTQKDKVEPRSPIQQIISGKESDAKKDLLKDFIQKVANTGSDILTSGDKGRKDSGLSSDLRLLFGSEQSSTDQVTLSASAKLSQMGQTVSTAKADRAKITEAVSSVDAIDQAENERGLENHLSTDRNSIRDQIQKMELQGDSILEKNELTDPTGDGAADSLETIDQSTEGGAESEDVERGESLGLSRNQRILGLSEEGADSDDRSDERNQEEQSNQDHLDNFKLASKSTKDSATITGVDKAQDESDQTSETDKDRELDAAETKDTDKVDDNDIEASQGGRIQVGTSNDSSDQSDKGSDQSRDREEKVDASKLRAKHAEKQDNIDNAIEKYTQTLRTNLVGMKKDLFAVGQQEDALLKEYGITSRQLKDIQIAVKKSVKEEIRNDIKDAIINKQLSLLDQYDSAAGDARLNRFTDYFVNNMLLGGQDFGNFDEGFQGMINKAMYFASKDLADFALDELGEFVMSASVDPNADRAEKIKNFEQKVSDLNTITNNPKITEEWAQTAMEAMMKNLGLAKETIPDTGKTTGLSVNVNAGDSGQQQSKREKHGYEYEEKDEKDIFINRLRALYLQRAMSPGMRTTLDTEFKIRKLKNGLLKLGVYTDVLNERIQKEAEMVAKDNILDMLREALEERSTLYELKGPAYLLIEHKIKGILKNADKAGISIDKAEFNKLRDESNHRMFEITRKEVEMNGVRLSEMDLPQLVVRHREMMKLMSRLKDESNMADELPGDDRYSVISTVETA